MSIPEFGPALAHAPSLREQVEKALTAAVASGELEPGTLLTVPTLAGRFHVSATPVREALLELERRGFVAPVRNKGFRVSEVSVEQLHRIAEVRMLLEPAAMEQLASSFDPNREQEMRGLADVIVSSAEGGDLVTYLTTDNDFHERLTQMVGNPVLTGVVMDLRSQARLSNLTRMSAENRLMDTAMEHHSILDALIDHDAAAAKSTMDKHIRHVAGIWAGNSED